MNHTCTCFEPGDLLILRGGKARVVTNLTPERVLENLSDGISVSDILGMTMMWDEVKQDTCGFVVSKIADQKTGFEMYFVLVKGVMVTVYGFHDGIEITDRLQDMHLVI